MATKPRDYAHEAETAKLRGEVVVGVKMPKDLRDRFAECCQMNGTTMNAVLRSYIKRYINGEFVWD